MTGRRGALALVVSAAPPVLRIGELVDALVEDGWTVCVTATPTAATWIDRTALKDRTGYPVRYRWRLPGEADTYPKADVVLVLPATFNLVNKWALGINDNPALGLLHETLGSGLPVLAFTCAKAALTSHPRYAEHLRLLRESGVEVTDVSDIRAGPEVYRWPLVVERLRDRSAPDSRS